MRVSTDLLIDDEAWGDEALWQGVADRAFAHILAETRIELRDGAEVSLLLCNDSRIRTLNREWRKKDRPTNVLSFPAPAPVSSAFVLGDIAVSHETAFREALEEGKTFVDHVTHLLVHGFLHLLGYDHENDTEALVMEKLERNILAGMNISDPYSETKNPLQAIPEARQG